METGANDVIVVRRVKVAFDREERLTSLILQNSCFNID